MPFALTKETMEMEWKTQMGKENSQILLEGDMIVPDSKPDLQELMQCEGRMRMKESRISDDRLSFSGELEACVLYRAKNGEKPLYAMKVLLPVEDFIHMEGLQRGMAVSLHTEMEHLDCYIINDRKIGVKAVLRIEAAAEEKKTALPLTDLQGEGVETLTEQISIEREIMEGKDRFTVKEEIVIPPSRPEIGEILTESVSLTEQEVRPMEGKALVRGNLCICLLYTDEEGNLGSLTEKIPFSGYLEDERISTGMELMGQLTVENCRLTPAVDEDGETRLLTADMTVGTMLKGRGREEVSILADAYASCGTVSLKKEKITYPVTAAAGKNQFMVQERIRLAEGEEPMLRTETVWGEVCLSEGHCLMDSVEAEGVMTADILYHCADDSRPVALLNRGIPFTQVMELKGVLPTDEADITLRLEDVDFQMLSETEGELRGTLIMEAAGRRQETAELVTEAIWNEAEDRKTAAGAVIYVVQKGDSLWKIAKKYRTTVDNIVAVNEIEDPELIYPGQKLLIIKMKR